MAGLQMILEISLIKTFRTTAAQFSIKKKEGRGEEEDGEERRKKRKEKKRREKKKGEEGGGEGRGGRERKRNTKMPSLVR